MKKLFILIFFVLSVVDLYAADPQFGIGQIDPNRGPCVTNYTRKAPGLCLRTAGSYLAVNDAVTGCRTIGTDLPVNAISALVSVVITVQSQNAVALRGGDIIFSPTGACSVALGEVSFTVMENPAQVAGTVIGIQTQSTVFVPALSGNIFMNAFNTGSGYQNGKVYIVGYTD